eukprot:gene8338-biopygen15160
MTETNTCIYSGSKANALGPSGGRGRSDAEGEHLAATKPVLVSVGTPSGSDKAPWRHPRKSEISRFWWILAPGGPPLDPPHPERNRQTARPAAAGRAAASPSSRDRQFSPSARFMLRMAETDTCIYSGSEANAPGPGVA